MFNICSRYSFKFSSEPALLKLGVENTYTRHGYWRTSEFTRQRLLEKESQYKRELESMYTGDCSNTDFNAVCAKLKELDSKNAPDWIVVLSDMEMDNGSNQTKDEMMNIFKRMECIQSLSGGLSIREIQLYPRQISMEISLCQDIHQCC